MAHRAQDTALQQGGADKRLSEPSYNPQRGLSEFVISSEQQEVLLFSIVHFCAGECFAC